MDRLPAWPALVLVCLELVAIVWFVEDKCFAVRTEGFLSPGFLVSVLVRWGACVSPGGSSFIFLIQLLAWCASVTASSCYQCIHLVHHCIHVGLVHCCHCCNLFVVFDLSQMLRVNLLALTKEERPK